MMTARAGVCWLLMTSLTTGDLNAAPSLPAGWRLPRADETAQSWRAKSASRFLLVKGNFAGGGKVDTAMILIRDDGSGFAPFVALVDGKHELRFLPGEETNPISYLPDEGIKLLGPGKYLTVCGKGYGCAENDIKSVTLSTDSIEFFKHDGPARVIYWDKSKRALSEVWLSD